MGGLTQALAKAAKDLGVEIRTEAEVGQHPRQGRRGRRRRPGRRRRVPRHARSPATLDPHLTFEKLLDPKLLPADFAEAVERIDYDSASLKINVALSELPNFTRLPGDEPGPQHRGTIHICPDQDYIERAYDDAKYGRPSREPDPRMHACRRRSIRRVAPPGKHLMSMFIQYAPYKLKEGHLGRAARTSSPTAASTSSTSTRRTSSSSVIARQVADAAGPGAHLQPDRRQHLPGGDDAQPALPVPPGGRLRRLPHADQGPVPVRRGGPPRRRRHGHLRLERGAGDAEKVVARMPFSRRASGPRGRTRATGCRCRFDVRAGRRPCG